MCPKHLPITSNSREMSPRLPATCVARPLRFLPGRAAGGWLVRAGTTPPKNTITIRKEVAEVSAIFPSLDRRFKVKGRRVLYSPCSKVSTCVADIIPRSSFTLFSRAFSLSRSSRFFNFCFSFRCSSLCRITKISRAHMSGPPWIKMRKRNECLPVQPRQDPRT